MLLDLLNPNHSYISAFLFLLAVVRLSELRQKLGLWLKHHRVAFFGFEWRHYSLPAEKEFNIARRLDGGLCSLKCIP